MFWLLPFWLNVLLGLWVTSLGIIYYFFTFNFNYWEKKRVIYEKGYPFVGSLYSIMTLKDQMLIGFDKIYKKYAGERFVGIYQGRKPTLLIMDPELIKCVLVRDFSHFYDHGFKFHEEADPLEARNLFNLEGKKWKEMRSKLSPTFTSGKIKMMTPLMEEVAKNLQAFFLKASKDDQDLDIKEFYSRYTTDVIGSCVFGINCNSIQNPDHEFRKMGKSLLHVDFWRGLKAMIIMFLPEVGLALRLAFINETITNFFRKMVSDVMALRKKTGQSRRDFMQLLIELKEKGHVSVRDDEEEKEAKELSGGLNESLNNKSTIELTNDDFAAQAAIFFLAGFETSSTVLTFASLELAANPDFQRKAQLEIDEVLAKHDGALTYEALQEMKYLDCIIHESMRKYPPGGNIIRVCTKNYTIPGTNVQIEKGVNVILANYSIQNDPQYFPDPENFNPERFNEESALQKYQFWHVPFGVGPRMCIGNRFAMMQTKMGLASILSKFELTLSQRTSYPVQFDPKQLVISNIGGIWLKAKPRFEE